MKNSANSSELKQYDATWSDNDNKCIILITDEDTQSFYNNLPVPGETTKPYSLKEFVNWGGNIFEQYGELVEKKSGIECHKIPGLFMVWNDRKGDRMIMDQTSGLSPYTKEGENFDFQIRSVEIHEPAVYKLPDTDKFAVLKDYFVGDLGLSPFSSETYNITKDFCYSPNPGVR